MVNKGVESSKLLARRKVGSGWLRKVVLICEGLFEVEAQVAHHKSFLTSIHPSNLFLASSTSSSKTAKTAEF